MKRLYLSSNAVRLNRTQRRQGFAAVYVALALPVLFGAAAIAFDLSYLYNRKAAAQNAADAAALAGAVNGESGTASKPGALDIAKANGYDTTKGATVVVGPDATHAGWYRATVSRPERVYFARLFSGGTSNVGATAVAEYLADADVPLQEYGFGAGPVNFSVFGPNAWHYNGDPYSVKLLSDGSPNPEYHPNGYDFNMKLRDTASWYDRYKTRDVQVEIFDPGTGNSGGSGGPNGGPITAIDEMRSGHSGKVPTDTRYTLWFDNNTPGTPGDDIKIDSKTYDDSNQGPDMQWDNPSEFKFSLDDPRIAGKPGNFRIQVQSIDGSSENGFSLRAGPPHDTMTEQEWSDQYGNSASGGAAADLSARGNIPMNFNQNGPTTIVLGGVPELPEGGQVIISKFDTDVGSKSVTYNDTHQDYPGVLSSNDTTVVDTIPLPKGYQGGMWKATYTAGAQDTSLWSMRYTGVGNLRLIR